MRKPIFTQLKDEGVIKGGVALDLGCGKGTHAKFLSDTMDCIVIGVDKNKDNTDELNKHEGTAGVNRSIESYFIGVSVFDLIIASYSLQFLTKEDAKDVIKKIINGVKKHGGVVYLTLIGEKDEWVGNPEINWSHWTSQEFEEFIKDEPITVRNKNVFEGKGDTLKKGMKHWHVLEYVLIKN